MAFMGVKWGSGGGGGLDSSVADVFAKAMFGDPEREMKLALGRSDLETDLYRRAQIESATRANAALAAQREFEKQAIAAGGAAAGQLWYDQNQPPAPVEVATPTPDVPIPIPTPRPDIQNLPPIYQPGSVEPDMRISTYPMQGYEMSPQDPFQEGPAPVAVDTGQVEPNFEIRTAAPSAPPPGPQYPEDLAAAQAMPVPVNEFPPFFDPEMLRSVPPELRPRTPDTTATQVPGRPITELMGDRPPPPSLVPTPVPTGPHEPAVVDIPGRETPDTMTFAPPIDPRLSGPMSGTAGQPATATGAELPAGAPSPEPQVMPGPQPDTITVSDPKTGGLTTMSLDQAKAIATAMMVNGGNVGGNIGAMQGAMEIIGQPGQTPDVRQTTLYTGSAPSKDSAAAAGLNGPVLDPETGMPSLLEILNQSGGDAKARGLQFMSAVEDRRNKKQPLSRQEKQMYVKLRQEFYPTTTTTSSANEGGYLNVNTVEAGTPPGTLKPNQIENYDPNAQPERVPDNVMAAPAPVVGTEEQPATVDQISDPTATTKKLNAYDQGRISKVDGKDVKNYGGWSGEGEEPPSYTETTTAPGGAKVTNQTKGNRKSAATSVEMENNYAMMFDAARAENILENEKLPRPLIAVMDKLSSLSDGTSITYDLVNSYLTTDEEKKYARAILAFINAPIRIQSGAAIQPWEIRDLRNRYAPEGGASEESRLDTTAQRLQTLKGIRLSLNGHVPTDQLKALDMELAKWGVDLDKDIQGAEKRLKESKRPVIREGGDGDWSTAP